MQKISFDSMTVKGASTHHTLQRVGCPVQAEDRIVKRTIVLAESERCPGEGAIIADIELLDHIDATEPAHPIDLLAALESTGRVKYSRENSRGVGSQMSAGCRELVSFCNVSV